MSTYDELEKSAEQGVPLQVVVFTLGGQTWRYVNHPEALTIAAVKYNAMRVTSGDKVDTGGTGSSELKVSLPSNSELATLFHGQPPRDPLLIEIRETHWQEDGTFTDFQYTARGTCKSVSRTDLESTFTFETGLSALGSEGLVEKYSPACPHTVYGPRCQASVSLPGVSADITITDITNSGRILLVAETLTAGKYMGGVVMVNGRSATVAANTTDQITLVNPLFEVEINDTGLVAIPCPRTMEACSQTFKNLRRFGGTPYIPIVNQYEKGLT